ncbi:MAG: diacylglycerol kinase family lipid kinase [Herpetosiphonaceae bacterium]|nr:diacylglycerol kinase family lipid kinase [Herpetosiphonaceae bacterium]
MTEQPPRIHVLINPHGGSGQRKDAVANLQRLLATRLPHATVEMIKPGGDVTEQARAACRAGAEIIVASGGDGTVNSVAQAVIGSPAHLGVLPFGTLNHFAKALGIPLDLPAAVDLLAQPSIRCVDVGRVNDRYFVNNASLGLYPQLVELREHQKTVAFKPLRWVKALWEIVRTGKPILVSVEANGKIIRQRAWLLFVGNNEYTLDLLNAGQRRHLNQAKLDVLLVGARRRWRIARLAFSAGRGRIKAKPLLRFETEQIKVYLTSSSPQCVAFDGETQTMQSPFTFRTVPQALWVVAPPEELVSGG